ncbi:hypothetical protein CAEBREN_11020 [Caenorhabditis brenneri]|uniref:Uncharacterized protein n=1 Tax=Caenorhabditis brenneri TaxID=135651 RepID=G0N1L6_CAEBE|nr:hypothetical protein CAEBREN_11020 [Caenorhabditis brenneri]
MKKVPEEDFKKGQKAVRKLKYVTSPRMPSEMQIEELPQLQSEIPPLREMCEDLKLKGKMENEPFGAAYLAKGQRKWVQEPLEKRRTSRSKRNHDIDIDRCWRMKKAVEAATDAQAVPAKEADPAVEAATDVQAVPAVEVDPATQAAARPWSQIQLI